MKIKRLTAADIRDHPAYIREIADFDNRMTAAADPQLSLNQLRKALLNPEAVSCLIKDDTGAIAMYAIAVPLPAATIDEACVDGALENDSEIAYLEIATVCPQLIQMGEHALAQCFAPLFKFFASSEFRCVAAHLKEDWAKFFQENCGAEIKRVIGGGWYYVEVPLHGGSQGGHVLVPHGTSH